MTGLSFVSGRLHQEILSELQDGDAAAGLPQRAAPAAAGERLQRQGWCSHVPITRLWSSRLHFFYSFNVGSPLFSRRSTLWSWCTRLTVSASWTTPSTSTLRRRDLKTVAVRLSDFISPCFSVIFIVMFLFCFSPDPELPAALLAGDARPPAAAAGEPGDSRHLLRLRLHPL